MGLLHRSNIYESTPEGDNDNEKLATVAEGTIAVKMLDGVIEQLIHDD